MLLKVSDVAKRLSLSESKIRKMIDQRKLGFHRMDGAIRVSEEQIAEYLDETRQERGSEPRKPRIPRPRLKHIRL
jgi:excisionase family DNA binding protein